MVDGDGRDQIDRLVVAVDAHAVLPAPGFKRGNALPHGLARDLDDVVRQAFQIRQRELIEHGHEAFGAGCIAGHQ